MKLLSSFDLISYQPQIFTNSKKRFQKKFSGLLTMLSAVSSFIILVFFARKTFTRQNFTINSNMKIIQNPVLNNTGNPIIFQVSTPLATYFAPDYLSRLIQFKAEMWNGTNINGTNSLKIIPSNFSYCNKEKHFKNADPLLLQDIVVENLFYTDPGSYLDLFGFYGSKESYNFYQIYLIKCQNNTALNKTDCLPDSVINPILGNLFFEFYYIDNLVDSNNVDNPIQTQMKRTLTPISNTVYKRVWVTKQMIEYSSDYGYVFEDTKKFTGFADEQQNYKIDVDLRTTSTYGSFTGITISLSNNVIVYSRSYEKIQQLIANAGGAFNTLYLIALFINYYFEHKVNQMIVFNVLFNDKKNYHANKNRPKTFSNRIDILAKQINIQGFSNTAKEESKLDNSEVKNVKLEEMQDYNSIINK